MRQRRRAERSQSRQQGLVEQRSRRDAERLRQRLLYAVGVVLVLLLIGLLLAGFYFSSFRPPRKAVAQVDGADIQLRQVLDRTRLLGRLVGTADPQQALNRLIRDEVLQQQAGVQFGVSVIPQEVEQILVNRFETLPDPDDEESLPPLSLTSEGRKLYQEFLDLINVGDKEYRAYLTGELLLGKVTTQIGLQAPDPQEQVYLHVIAAGSEAENEAALERLAQGEEFSALAEELNRQVPYAGENGEVGWVPHGVFPDLDEDIFSAEVDQLIGPLDSVLGSVIAKITQGLEMQPLSSSMRDILGRGDTNEWLQTQLSRLLVGYSFNGDDRRWVLDRLN